MHWKEVRAKVKYEVIYRHHHEYPIAVMCRFFKVSRSGYYAYLKGRERPDKDMELSQVIQTQQESCRGTYGYRRMQMCLEKQGVYRNPKTILRVMRKYDLLSEVRRKRKWRQLGQQMHKYENLLNREF